MRCGRSTLIKTMISSSTDVHSNACSSMNSTVRLSATRHGVQQKGSAQVDGALRDLIGVLPAVLQVVVEFLLKARNLLISADASRRSAAQDACEAKDCAPPLDRRLVDATIGMTTAR